MTINVEQADFHDVPDDPSLDCHGDAATDNQDATASSSYRSTGGESSTSAQSSARHAAASADNDPCSSVSPIPKAAPDAPESPALASVPSRRSSLPSIRSKSEAQMCSVAKKSAIAVIAVDTERIIAENLESTKTITHLKLQLAEGLSTMDSLRHSHQLLKEKLHEAKDEAYAHSAQHQKEVSSLREELDEVTKDRDDLTRELETTREERENARREVTRMKMLSIKQQQRRLSTDTTESTMSTASSMGSGGGGRRGSMLQSFCESSRNLLGGGGSGQGAGTDAAASAANTPAQNRKSSLTVADLQISRRNLMLNQQGNAATGGPYMYGQRGSATTNSASLALALANANASSNGDGLSGTLPKRSSATNLQGRRNSGRRRSSSGGPWFRRLNGGAGATNASFENSQDSFSSIRGLDGELSKLDEQQAGADSSNLMLPGRGASPSPSPLVATNAIFQGGTSNDDDLSKEDEESITNAADIFLCRDSKSSRDDSHSSQELEKDEYDPRSYLSEVDAVGWATRQKSLSDDTNASDGAVALGDDVARRNSLTARRA